MYTAQLPNQGPFSIRYPRGNGVMLDWKSAFKKIKIGKGRKIKDGKGIAILSLGHTGNFVLKAQESFRKEGLDIAHYDMRFAKPLDESLLHKIFANFHTIITIEDGCLQGGFGSAILEFMANNNYQKVVKRLGIPDKFINHGTQEELHADCNYDSKSIIKIVHKVMQKNLVSQVG